MCVVHPKSLDWPKESGSAIIGCAAYRAASFLVISGGVEKHQSRHPGSLRSEFV